MKYLALAIVFAAALHSVTAQQQQTQQQAIPNPAINMDEHLRLSLEAAKHRDTRRVTEDDFIKMSQEKGVVILDARSKEKFDLLHIKGAVNLSFPDITVESLNRLFPDKETRILIYCNNNFKNAEVPFPTKRFAVALNLSTYITMYGYGYRNIYELGPQLDPAKVKLTFESTPIVKK